jgi:anti-sigma-K factor RskA
MVHDDYKELIPAHALSALDAADERVLNKHLAECDECRRELADWEATAATLALSAKPMEPSPQVREKLLSQIRSEGSGSTSQGGLGAQSGTSRSEPQSGSENSRTDHSGSNVIPFDRSKRTIWNSLGSLGSIAAVILFAALIVSVFVLWQQNRELRQQNELYQLLTAPGSRMAELSGTAEATGATAMLAYDTSGRAMLITHGLPRAPEGKQYQLWFIVNNNPLPGKAFSIDSSGRTMMTDQVPESARHSAVFAVTLEPAGGVPSPTGSIYLRSAL